MSAADWYPDPGGRHEVRYWDGQAWTDWVTDNGVQSTDPLPPPPAEQAGGLDRFDRAVTIGDEGRADLIQTQLHGTGHRGVGIQGTVEGGGGSIFNEPILIVNQKAKLIELNNQYSVFDQSGNQLAAVSQVGQSTAKKVARLVTSVDQFMTHKLQAVDGHGNVLLNITRPAKLIKSTVIVSNGQGQELGRIVQQNAIGKINFALVSNNQQLGTIKAENWRAWNFQIIDHQGVEIARITKTFEGLAKTLFTTADNYVVQIAHRTPEPLNSLVVASALSIDTALKQDARGFG
jgi:uncharacterized protein YxjI